eukprot:UN05555
MLLQRTFDGAIYRAATVHLKIYLILQTLYSLYPQFAEKTRRLEMLLNFAHFLGHVENVGGSAGVLYNVKKFLHNKVVNLINFCEQKGIEDDFTIHRIICILGTELAKQPISKRVEYELKSLGRVMHTDLRTTKKLT